MNTLYSDHLPSSLPRSSTYVQLLSASTYSVGFLLTFIHQVSSNDMYVYPHCQINHVADVVNATGPFREASRTDRLFFMQEYVMIIMPTLIMRACVCVTLCVCVGRETVNRELETALGERRGEVKRLKEESSELRAKVMADDLSPPYQAGCPPCQHLASFPCPPTYSLHRFP